LIAELSDTSIFDTLLPSSSSSQTNEIKKEKEDEVSTDSNPSHLPTSLSLTTEIKKEKEVPPNPTVSNTSLNSDDEEEQELQKLLSQSTSLNDSSTEKQSQHTRDASLLLLSTPVEQINPVSSSSSSSTSSTEVHPDENNSSSPPEEEKKEEKKEVEKEVEKNEKQQDTEDPSHLLLSTPVEQINPVSSSSSSSTSSTEVHQDENNSSSPQEEEKKEEKKEVEKEVEKNEKQPQHTGDASSSLFSSLLITPLNSDFDPSYDTSFFPNFSSTSSSSSIPLSTLTREKNEFSDMNDIESPEFDSSPLPRKEHEPSETCMLFLTIRGDTVICTAHEFARFGLLGDTRGSHYLNTYNMYFLSRNVAYTKDLSISHGSKIVFSSDGNEEGDGILDRIACLFFMRLGSKDSLTSYLTTAYSCPSFLLSERTSQLVRIDDTIRENTRLTFETIFSLVVEAATASAKDIECKWPLLRLFCEMVTLYSDEVMTSKLSLLKDLINPIDDDLEEVRIIKQVEMEDTKALNFFIEGILERDHNDFSASIF
jgi:hypothetical protein